MGFGAVFIAASAPSGGYDSADLLLLVASLVVGFGIAKFFEAALIPDVGGWSLTSWRQRLTWFLAMVFSGAAVWLLSGHFGSGLTLWPILWAECIGSCVLDLLRAKEYGRWKRDRYEADLREVGDFAL